MTEKKKTISLCMAKKRARTQAFTDVLYLMGCLEASAGKPIVYHQLWDILKKEISEVKP
jgi:hypothetical protein